MRRWITAVVLAGATVLGLAGCGLPAGVDGNLTNQWAAMPAAEGFTPSAGTCHLSYATTAYRQSYQPQSCDDAHMTETVYVGTADGLAEPPKSGTADYGKLIQSCEAKVNEFVGGDWHDGRLWFGLTFPGLQTWQGGAHWYRCELLTLDQVLGEETQHTGSLKGELAKPGSTVRLGCFSYTSGKAVTPVACTKKHNAEYVGSVAMPSFAAVKDRAKVIKVCQQRIAAYVGMKYSSDLKYRTGLFWDPMTESEYAAGDHKIRCFAWFSPDTKTKSIKGAGAKALPIHYA
ncbi:MAG: septum formation family protein [Hamadaea sp.]|uniref:septum formation family protein n=1 Tax=Hamadaea sp. TaxID=2024425 RepID=UPI0017E8DB3E|nr:septum formation family protein [Hamadaea sp.]NUR72021.1 septum formation family protein [Hamadaea sp.]NUT17571.1 septum formation family protein [Hamadaea sp.]